VAVSGAVSDGNGTAIVNAVVQGRYYGGGEGYEIVETRTAADGTYTLYGLPGDWRVTVYDNTGYNHSTQTLAGLTTPSSTFLSGVTGVGATLDITYYRAAVVTGTLTKADTGEVVPGAAFSIVGDATSRGRELARRDPRLGIRESLRRTINASLYWNTSLAGYSRPARSPFLILNVGDMVALDPLATQYIPFSVTFSGIAVDSFGHRSRARRCMSSPIRATA